MTTIVWFRNDLRLRDNPALNAASLDGSPIIPVYILEQDEGDMRPYGGASKWWLHQSLESLRAALEREGGQLILRRGRSQDILLTLIKETGATAVYWNRCYDPHAIARDRKIKELLGNQGIKVKSFNSHLLFEPWEVKTGSGQFYKVFTPFWKACLARLSAIETLSETAVIRRFEQVIPSESISAFELLPKSPNWAESFGGRWEPGEEGAHKRLEQFITTSLCDYGKSRDIPGVEGTSKLSAHLHFGEISPRQIVKRIQEVVRQSLDEGLSYNAGKYCAEIGWREFSYHLLYHFPQLPSHNFQRKFDAFSWDPNYKETLQGWQRGMTGYPIVDAGMRELWQTGWMHNRVRMIVASFLTKHLLIPWQQGESWFWDTLVDADHANNAASWQWVAGCGADAAPYFRIFNPILQGEKFDPDGTYVRRWVPEVALLPNAFIHKPWEASEVILKQAGVSLGQSYPRPIVDHAYARDRALQAFKLLNNA
jgi:deoxyribodipyrimidine photo-lyase